MKKFLLSVLVLACCCMSNAQITLLHTFPGELPQEFLLSYISASPLFEYVQEPLDCYVFVDIQNYDIKFYNSNFQLVKNPSFSSSPIFYNGSIHIEFYSFFGKHLVNTDDKVEILINAQTLVNVDEWGGTTYSSHYYVINEDGDIVCDLGNSEIIPYTVHKVDNQLRVIGYGPNGQTEIYALGGNYNPSTMVTYTQRGSFPNPYPNPSRNIITLPYTLPSGETSQLRVFNMSGQLVETFNIGSDFDKIQINVSNYPKGTYIYTYNGVTKKFVVQ